MDERALWRKLNTPEQLPERITDVFIVLMSTVFLCAFGPKGYLNIVQVKYGLFCAITGAYCVLSAVLLIINLIRERHLPTLKQFGTARVFIAFYALFTLLSFAFSDCKAQSLIGMTRYEGLVTILLYCAAALFVSICAVPKMLHLFAFAAGMSANCIIAILQLLKHNPLGLFPAGLDYYDKGILYSGAYLGTTGNVDLLSGIIAIAIPLFCYFTVTQYTKRFSVNNKANMLLFIPSALTLIVFAGMRVSGCILGVVCGILVFLPFFFKEKTRKRMILTETICLLVLIAGSAYVYTFGLSIGSLSIPAHFSIPDSGRLFIWKNVLELIKQRPFSGYGPDTLSAYMTAHFERLNPLTNTVITASIDVAHNEYLNVWVNQGIFAMLSFTGIIAGTLIAGNGKPDKSILILKCALLCYAVQAFFEFSMIINAPFFWILTGLIISVEYPLSK